MLICVTGGAGYVGAHVVRLLQQAGLEVIVIDDLSYGDATRVGSAELVQLDLADTAELPRLQAALDGCTAVVHIAGRKQVGESVERPAWYYQQNVGGMANLLLAMQAQDVDRLVFSSSAAVYGQPSVGQVREDLDLKPINPYGESKLIGEWLVRDAARAWGLRGVNLRYFNVAGAGWEELGDPAVLNLIPMVLEKLSEGRPPAVFGGDYPTADGTCVRDYIHVIDIATAHMIALDYLDRDQRPFDSFNVGTGAGASVRQVIEMIGEVTGLDTTPAVKPRRPGDPAVLIGAVDRIEQTFEWKAQHDLRSIIDSSWRAWQAGPRRIASGAGR
ncbi:MAG: UDP-glucose 4-epimerase GalE [Bifidobacteriaceae bacterium]|jgi:UDP-glucose 4-epimerase|nr:UDP-glucose 4-epimerase GalE [Bifidobacteriaceae bacterium]